MSDPLSDPLLLGQRVVAILETGLRTATYKLATLMALIDHCIEHLPDNPRDTLLVPIPNLAHRVLEIYWRQIRPFEGQELRQSTQPRARILVAVSIFRSSARRNASLEVAIVRAPAAYKAAIDEITLWLANLVLACARGLYRGQPSGVPTWSGYHQIAAFDISYPPWWIEIGP